jgi:hypothetical protein
MAEHRKSYRFTDEDIRIIAELAGYWGPVKALPDTEVIREALRRAVAAERATRHRKKNPGSR